MKDEVNVKNNNEHIYIKEGGGIWSKSKQGFRLLPSMQAASGIGSWISGLLLRRMPRQQVKYWEKKEVEGAGGATGAGVSFADDAEENSPSAILVP